MTVNIALKNTIDNSYNVEIGKLGKISFDTKVAIITNPKVAGLHLNYLLENLSAKEVYIVTVPDGEEFKSLSTVENILESLFNHRLDRKSLLIAFGGGVIGDMTGFTASIYQRGIDFIQIPTTLLSQVDASVGGKTGINNKFGKNLVGAFYQPRKVFIDSYFLKTLGEREYSAGIAEIVKMAVTFDKDFFEYLEPNDLKNQNVIEQAIKRSVEIKADVVARDEKENGIRAALNYGHTFAHVIEKESGYGAYLHGEAVAIGMVMANELSCKLGLMTKDEANRITALLKRYGLPTLYNIKDVDEFYYAFFLDKKSSNGKISFILASGIGDVEIKNDISISDVKSILTIFGE